MRRIKYDFLAFILILGSVVVINKLSDYLIVLTIPFLFYVLLNKNMIKTVFYFISIIGAYIGGKVLSNASINYGAIGTYVTVNILLGCLSRNILLLKSKALPTESNNILREIIELTFDKETVPKSSEKIANVLLNHYKIDYCTIFTRSDAGRLNISSTNIDGPDISEIEKYSNDLLSSMKNTNAIIHCSNTVLDYPTGARRGIKYLYFIPLMLGETILGAILIENVNREDLEKLEEDFFTIILENIAIVLQNSIYNEKLVSAANIDGLTKVYNRNYLKQHLVEEISRYKKNNMVFSMAIFDIDHFKKFNDTYGHLHGDKVLTETAQFIKSKIRLNDDVIYRYGGEEFVIFFSKSPNKVIYHKLDNIREELSRLAIKNEAGQLTPVTASFGLAEFPKDADNLDELLKRSDEALYNSKKRGRNRVTIYSNMKDQEENKHENKQ